jgi:hypothetical protein
MREWEEAKAPRASSLTFQSQITYFPKQSFASAGAIQRRGTVGFPCPVCLLIELHSPNELIQTPEFGSARKMGRATNTAETHR